jgi:NADPH:quinone reductase
MVVERGARVRRFKPGDQVWAYEYSNPKGGFYAEYVAVNVESVARVPRRLKLIEAGAACVTGLTAQQGIDQHLGITEGETLLIFGASGALGTLAVQFAKRRGARIIGTATGAEATKVVRDLGADEVVDGRSHEAPDRLRAVAPEGLDAILALAGGEILERCVEQVRPGGRVACPNGVEPEPTRRPRVKLVAYDGIAGRDEFEALERAVEEAQLRVVIGGVYPLERAAEAHAQVERGRVIGRVVLRVRDEGS